MNIINIETKIHVVYGLVDADGDCIKKIPYTFEITKHDAATFENLLSHLVKQREELVLGLEEAEKSIQTVPEVE